MSYQLTMFNRWWRPRTRPDNPVTRFHLEGLPELRFKLHPAGDPWVSGVIARNEVFDPHIVALLRLMPHDRRMSLLMSGPISDGSP